MTKRTKQIIPIELIAFLDTFEFRPCWHSYHFKDSDIIRNTSQNVIKISFSLSLQNLYYNKNERSSQALFSTIFPYFSITYDYRKSLIYLVILVGIEPTYLVCNTSANPLSYRTISYTIFRVLSIGVSDWIRTSVGCFADSHLNQTRSQRHNILAESVRIELTRPYFRTYGLAIRCITTLPTLLNSW